jgi:D-alanyl-D-alanine carboxypeptidase (penicillin-binding protein 5/6)
MATLARILVALALSATVPFVARTAAAATITAPPLTAKAALLSDAGSGALLWARNPDLALPPASTTKVMTAILALENGAGRDVFAVSPVAARMTGSTIHLRAGQKLVLSDLMYALLLKSANDASVVIAEGLAGSVGAFATRMTQRAKELGALQTHFVDPAGVAAYGNSTTVRDLAIIFRHALALPRFRRILSVDATEIGIVQSPTRIPLHSHNRLLDSPRFPTIGKTGFTSAAGKCFVGASRSQGRRLIVAVLGSTELWSDTTRLLEFGFGTDFPNRPIVERVRVPSIAVGVARFGTDARMHGYVIEVGAFGRKTDAERLRHSLERRGYKVSVERALGKARAEYRVAVGIYPDQRRAELAARALRGQIDVPTRIARR